MGKERKREVREQKSGRSKKLAGCGNTPESV
jgi:hypothetical protein